MVPKLSLFKKRYIFQVEWLIATLIITYEPKILLPQRRIQSSLQRWLELLHRETGPDTPNYLQENMPRMPVRKIEQNLYSPPVFLLIIRLWGKLVLKDKFKCDKTKTRVQKKERKLHFVMDQVRSAIVLKGRSQPHLRFCLHARVWLLYFFRSILKTRRSL